MDKLEIQKEKTAAALKGKCLSCSWFLLGSKNCSLALEIKCNYWNIETTARAIKASIEILGRTGSIIR